MATGREPAPAKYLRTRPPAHYLLEISSFDALSTTKKFDSAVFEAGGYKWKLSLYPQGNEEAGVSGHISLYLSIVDPPANKTVPASCRLFVRAVRKEKNPPTQYLTNQDANGAVTSFGRSNGHRDGPNYPFGFHRFLSLKEFKDRSNGYLDKGGSCVFGAEVFVIPPAGPMKESFTLTRYPPTPDTLPVLLRFQRWSQRATEVCREELSLGGRRWNLSVHPKGYGPNRDKSLSVYIKALDLAENTRVYAKFTVRVLDQREEEHKRKNKERTFDRWLSESTGPRGWPAFMPLDDLSPKGTGSGQKFVKNDTLVAEVQITALSNPVAE